MPQILYTCKDLTSITLKHLFDIFFFPKQLLKVVDYHESSFQDFVGHNDAVQLVRFTPSGKQVFTVAYNQILVWEVVV